MIHPTVIMQQPCTCCIRHQRCDGARLLKVASTTSSAAREQSCSHLRRSQATASEYVYKDPPPCLGLCDACAQRCLRLVVRYIGIPKLGSTTLSTAMATVNLRLCKLPPVDLEPSTLHLSIPPLPNCMAAQGWALQRRRKDDNLMSCLKISIDP